MDLHVAVEIFQRCTKKKEDYWRCPGCPLDAQVPVDDEGHTESLCDQLRAVESVEVLGKP